MVARQEYWSGLLCPPPGDLTNPGIKSVSPVAPALQVDSSEPLGKPAYTYELTSNIWLSVS